jgi:hypothetical protein
MKGTAKTTLPKSIKKVESILNLVYLCDKILSPAAAVRFPNFYGNFIAHFYGHILVSLMLILNVGESVGVPPQPMALDARRLTQFIEKSYIHFYYL